MPKLFGAQRLILQAILDAQGDSSAFIEDTKVAQATKIALRDTRDWLLTLDHDEYVDLALTENGLRAAVTAKGRLALGLFRPFPTQTPAPLGEPSRARTKTGGERALVIGVSEYPAPIPKLPAVANDVREVAALLGSDKGEFQAQNVASFVDQAADRQSVLTALEKTFREVRPEDPVFAYMAGHGAVVNDEYFFVAHDTKADALPATGVPLKDIKAAFDASPSQRAFLWLDFCHSGGILARDIIGTPDDRAVIERSLKVVQGQGKLILAASTAYQSAWEQGKHGLFTDALLRGLKGGAAKDGEVTVNSLYDFIDRQMGSERQRPMMSGQMTGRVVLMHYM
jgi:Caspase domain